MNTSQKSILLVEDEQMLLDLYTTILTSEGYRVTQALDGIDALHAIKEGSYDLILLDTMMPKMDGLKVLETLQKEGFSGTKKRNIFMLSNLDQESIMQKALSLGAMGYLIKSDYTPDQLLATIRKHLN
jgi:DNA-binding response OmpR family regulator